MVHHYAPIAVNTGSKLVVIDTGFGPGTYARSKGEMGQFYRESRRLRPSISRRSDLVVISHFHPDHVDGLDRWRQTRLVYPNAEILVPAPRNGSSGMDDGEMSRASKGRMEDLFQGQPPGVRRARPQGDTLRMEQGGGARADADGHARPLHRPHLVHSVIGFEQGLHPVGRLPTIPICFARHPELGCCFSIRIRKARRWKRAARSMTCWSPDRDAGAGLSTTRSRGLAHVEKAEGGRLPRGCQCPGARRSDRGWVDCFTGTGRPRAAFFHARGGARLTGHGRGPISPPMTTIACTFALQRRRAPRGTGARSLMIVTRAAG